MYKCGNYVKPETAIAATKMIDVVIIVIRNGIVKQKQNVNLIVGMMIMITKMM